MCNSITFKRERKMREGESTNYQERRWWEVRYPLWVYRTSAAVGWRQTRKHFVGKRLTKTNRKSFCWDILEDIIWRKSFWKEILEINRWVKTNKPLIFVLCLFSICVLFPFTFFIYIIWLLLRGWTMKSKLFYVFLALVKPNQAEVWLRFQSLLRILPLWTKGV